VANPAATATARPPLLFPRSEWDNQRVRVCEPNQPPYQAVVIGTIFDGNVYDPRLLVRVFGSAHNRSVRIAHVALIH